MTPSDLRDWQASQSLTYDTAAVALGVSRSTYAAWVGGTTRIDRRTALACAAIVAGLEPAGQMEK